ncbi:carbon starvation protein A [Synechococcales cyanobacterium C]|uniref:Carbon starvation protein A n=1 Tax=Petrachloros mirabilis ULC683 TaxID=2781853 RepID=A0A8K2A9N3_9CYAN|nr:carbon starvation protein A [Petrachloros mirabilis]NCJ08210.1 carbon starvation protein A [Petrachloros mirabilis ULC683]
MSAAFLAILGWVAFFLGYRFYSRWIAKRIYRLRADAITPAHTYEDGIDYVPTNPFILWGHHFTSVAGAAPIVGPAIAVIWGWLPAFLWVILGTIFIGGVHDFGALWASVRNQGRSIGSLTEDVVGRRARSLFMIIIFLLLLMVNAVFAVVIANLFVNYGSSILPAWSAIVVAVVIGYLLYRRGVGLLWPSLGGLAVLYLMVYLGDVLPFPQLSAPIWILLLFAYAFVASLLPVWLLLQPRDYINSLQLFLALGLLYLAVLVANPTLVAPAFNFEVPADAPAIVPLLFVTIACGAISGFHGLVSSGTSAKQLDRETDARFVGYLGAVGEGALALATILATTAGFASRAEWQGFYQSFTSGGLSAFVQGGSTILNTGLGIPTSLATTLLAVIAVLFAGTTMDTAVRLQRYIIEEWGQIYQLPALTNRYLATSLAVVSCLILAFGAGGVAGTGGMTIWPLFGTTNQLLAALTLLVITVLLVKLARPYWYTLVPLVFVLLMTVSSLLLQLGDFWSKQDYFLLGLDTLILVAAIWVVLEAAFVFNRARMEARIQKVID